MKELRFSSLFQLPRDPFLHVKSHPFSISNVIEMIYFVFTMLVRYYSHLSGVCSKSFHHPTISQHEASVLFVFHMYFEGLIFGNIFSYNIEVAVVGCRWCRKQEAIEKTKGFRSN